ncbi:sirohydrochlorin chelatase [Streptomyces sp. NPDC091377]|uniref:sirohydrochlorin chelatase n=1 Tax=Streptomyces sp. NPDC091377 TaxID=3365995 RepID=UPI00380C0346
MNPDPGPDCGSAPAPGPAPAPDPDPAPHPGPGPDPAPDPALVLVAHGSRDPRALATVRALAAQVRALRPALRVHLGHLELNAPLLPDTLAALGDTEEAVLVPLLLGRGHHVTRDLPETAAARPGTPRTPRPRTTVAAPLGPHPLLTDALHTRLTEAGWPVHLTERERRTAGVVLAAAGSLAPGSAADTTRAAHLLSARLGVPVLPAYASAARPTIPEAVTALTALGRPRAALASYFTAPGRLAGQCANHFPGAASAPLGTHPAMARLILERYREAIPAHGPVRHDPTGAAYCQ